jgi:hypothetical protein
MKNQEIYRAVLMRVSCLKDVVERDGWKRGRLFEEKEPCI